MPYKVSPHVAVVVAKDAQGHLQYHYQGGPLGAGRGPYIPWLGEEQRAHFLRKGLVVEVSEVEAPNADLGVVPEGVAVNPDLVGECIDALDRAVIKSDENEDIPVPSDAGAPTARKALRDSGLSFGNDVIAAAVRQRKLRAS